MTRIEGDSKEKKKTMFTAVKIFVPAIQCSYKLQDLGSWLPGCTQKTEDEMSKLYHCIYS